MLTPAQQFLKFALILCLAATASYAGSWWLWSAHAIDDSLLRMKRRPALPQSSDDAARIGRRVDELWTRIENQLKVICKEDFDRLAPGCRPDELEDLEDRLGFNLPLDVRASLLRHNGDLAEHRSGRCEFGGMFTLFSVNEIRQRYAEEIERWCWAGQRKWVEHSDTWPTSVGLAISIDFYFQVECTSSNIHIGRHGHDPWDFIANDWTSVLEAWAVALEEKKYSIYSNGIIVDNWAGLNPY